MARGVRLYLVGSFVLVSLAGCGRFFQAEREPWRAEAEVACLKSGAVKEGPDLVLIEPIDGPGVCGAQFPLKVAVLGEGSSTFGFADDLRPPASIGNEPRWPVTQPAPAQSPYSNSPQRQPGYALPSNGPISLTPPGVQQQDDEIDLPPDGAPAPQRRPPYAGAPPFPQRDRYPPSPSQAPYSPAPYSERPGTQPLPRLGPVQGNPVTAVGPVAIKPTATLACPIVSVLERWLADSVQPAAQRWFGARVVEIKQISAYSCRGMNGNPNAHISEHAFGNALDIAAFTLADGRRITVKDGWRGMPEEQGFLRDVQAAACQQFNTVLAPGSNRFHYDHIHVDLMRRASGSVICQPSATSGDEVAARAAGRNSYAFSRDPSVTGALGGRKTWSRGQAKVNEEDEFEDE
jgi:hypothetical protein